MFRNSAVLQWNHWEKLSRRWCRDKANTMLLKNVKYESFYSKIPDTENHLVRQLDRYLVYQGMSNHSLTSVWAQRLKFWVRTSKVCRRHTTLTKAFLFNLNILPNYKVGKARVSITLLGAVSKRIGICFTFQRCISSAGMENRTRDVGACRLRTQRSSLAWFGLVVAMIYRDSSAKFI
jgi:hypothetical protein